MAMDANQAKAEAVRRWGPKADIRVAWLGKHCQVGALMAGPLGNERFHIFGSGDSWDSAFENSVANGHG